MDSPIVSIILPTYNRGQYIKKSIESALIQTFKDFELIIIDDASIDSTPEIIFNFSKRDSRIKIITNEKNLGVVKSLNKAIKKSKGVYIARLDDDDYWADNKKLEKQIDFLNKNKDYVLVGGGIIRFDRNYKENVRHLLPEKDEDIKKIILIDNTFAHSAVVFRKDAWKTAGGYDKSLNFSEDWDLWLKLGKIGKMYNFQEYFLGYLEAGQNRSISGVKENLKINIKLRKKYRKDYPNFLKGYVLGWAYYLYIFFPGNNFLRPIFSRIKKIFLGEAVYKSYKINDKS